MKITDAVLFCSQINLLCRTKLLQKLCQNHILQPKTAASSTSSPRTLEFKKCCTNTRITAEFQQNNAFSAPHFCRDPFSLQFLCFQGGFLFVFCYLGLGGSWCFWFCFFVVVVCLRKKTFDAVTKYTSESHWVFHLASFLRFWTPLILCSKWQGCSTPNFWPLALQSITAQDEGLTSYEKSLNKGASNATRNSFHNSSKFTNFPK